MNVGVSRWVGGRVWLLRHLDVMKEYGRNVSVHRLRCRPDTLAERRLLRFDSSHVGLRHQPRGFTGPCQHSSAKNEAPVSDAREQEPRAGNFFEHGMGKFAREEPLEVMITERCDSPTPKETKACSLHSAFGINSCPVVGAVLDLLGNQVSYGEDPSAHYCIAH